MSYNEHTKKKMQTGIPSEEYRDNYDKIFGKKECQNVWGCWCKGKCIKRKEDNASNPS